jgi:hypothetical protein
MLPIPKTPSFALVGQPNEGKTTVMATMAEDDQAAISPVPGTTQTCRRYPVLLKNEEILVFYDTPGFENTAAVLKWFQDNRALREPLETFLTTFASGDRFRKEVEILKPLGEGAAAMYVADASRPVRGVDEQEVEILRLSGVRRIGVVNSKEEESPYLDDWRRLMSRDFNHIHQFNGHQATFRDRIHLLEAARAVIQEWHGPMDRSIAALRADWEERMRTLTTLIVRDLRALMELRKRETIQHAGDADRAKAEAIEAMKKVVREREQHFRKEVRRVFHHSDERWAVDELLELDIFHEKVWKVFGLTRNQLGLSGAIIGALIGGYIDAHTLGASFMTGALIGAILGGGIAWLQADRAMDVRLPDLEWKGFRLPGRKLGGQQAEASISPQSNVLWVVLDRYLLYVQLCASWAHGKRQQGPAAISQTKQGFTSHWANGERGQVMDFVGHLRRAKRNDEKLEAAEKSLRTLLISKLRELTHS